MAKSLTPIQKIEVAFHYHTNGVSQHVLASMYHINPGRIAEAVTAVNEAVGLVKRPKTNQKEDLVEL